MVGVNIRRQGRAIGNGRAVTAALRGNLTAVLKLLARVTVLSEGPPARAALPWVLCLGA